MTQNWSKFVVWADYALAAISALFFLSMLSAGGEIPPIAVFFKIIGYLGIVVVAGLHFLSMRQFRLASVETTAHYVGFAGAAIALFSFLLTFGWMGLFAAAALIVSGIYVTTSIRGVNLHATSAKKTVAVATKVEKETKSKSSTKAKTTKK